MTRSRAAASFADDLYEDHDAPPMPSPGKRTLTDRLVRAAGAEDGESFFQAGQGPIDAPALLELIAHELPRPARMRVTADGLYIRRTPAKERDNIVGGYRHGDLVDTVGRSGDWMMVSHRGEPAYVHGAYLEKVAEPKAEPKVEAPAIAAPPPHELAAHPQAMAIAAELRAAQALAARARKANNNEEVAADRGALVTALRTLREHIAQLPADLASLKPGFYRAAQDLAPYYHQRNLDLIGPMEKQKDGTLARQKSVLFTCNITSLAMTLESLGKTAADYPADPKLLVAATVLRGEETSRETLNALRLPDFMQLAAVAVKMKSAAPDEVEAARSAAREAVTKGAFIVTMADAFKAKASYREFDAGRQALKNEGDRGGYEFTNNGKVLKRQQRHEMMALALLRTRGKHAEHDQLLAKDRERMQAGNIDQTLSLDSYRSWIQKTVGKELGEGAVIVGMSGGSGHFVRLQAIRDDEIVVDDPGSWDNHDLKVSYEQARAMGCFWNRIVIK